MTHAITVAARSWLGTRFHHQGRLKKNATHKGGVDCLGLLIGVANELDLRTSQGMPLSHFDETDYTHAPDQAKLYGRLCGVLNHIPQSGINPGDVLLLEIDGRSQHLGIAGELMGQISLIHAYAPARAVVEHCLDAYWKSKVKAAFRI